MQISLNIMQIGAGSNLVGICMAGLGWLLPFGDEAKSILKRVCAGADEISGDLLWRLSHYDLPLSASQRILRRLQPENVPETFLKLNVAILSSDTLDHLASGLMGAGLKHGLACFGTAISLSTTLPTILSGKDPLKGEKYNFAVLMPSLSKLSAAFEPQADINQLLRQQLDDVRRVALWLAESRGVVPIITLPPPSLLENFNSSDVLIPWTEGAVRRRFIEGLCELAREQGWPVWNLDALAAEIGIETWFSEKQYYWAKLPFDLDHVMRVSDSLVRILAAASGKTRRVLVFDLDNTLWGGVVGDDGVEGLAIGEGAAAAEAHLALHNLGLALKKRGVALAVCSKNDDATARRPFRELPDMVLKEEDFAVFQANWDDKATNLKAIAEALNLTTSSLAFLDDNPAERERVRQEFPDIAVIEPGEDIPQFARRVLSSGFFEHLVLTNEDIDRAEEFRRNGSRAEILARAGNFEEYLDSLDMTLSIGRFDAASRQRIAQLIAKSNQFNLTTRRYSALEIKNIEESQARIGLQFRLADRFGDNGMISVIIVDRTDPNVWEIDTWLMSCRVLKRGVEDAALNAIVQLAKAGGAHRLRGRYFPTPKNGLVAQHYEMLGFRQEPSPPTEEGTVWALDLDGYRARAVHMNVEHSF